MTDTPPHGRFRDSQNPEEMPPPKSPYDLYMEARRKHAGVTIWFIEEDCPVCKTTIFTDGTYKWCGHGCTNTKNSPGTYSKLQEDYIR
jgi:hypothetical protein